MRFHGGFLRVEGASIMRAAALPQFADVPPFLPRRRGGAAGFAARPTALTARPARQR